MMPRLVIALATLLAACEGEVTTTRPDGSTRDAGREDAGSIDDDAGPRDGGETDAGMPDTGPTGPTVDRSEMQLYEHEFTANEVDPAATAALGTELAYLDTRVEPLGKLVVYLHGAGAPSTCGSRDHGRVLAAMGYHVVMPCYSSDYGVGNCGDDIEGCRLEAFEGVDHHSFVDIAPPDSIETRVVRALEHLATASPPGDWGWFVEGARPRWSAIVISGISHGASSSGVIGIHRAVDRVVMLSGPLDTDQAWLMRTPMTARDRFYGFSHTDDSQHPGHLEAFASLMLPGAPVSIDGASPPYGGSHRLITSAASSNGHSSTQAGGASPRDGTGAWLFQPAWEYLYLSPPGSP